MEHAMLRHIHNPRGRVCGCDADCWCRRTALGRLVTWWFPGRYFGLQHRNAELELWKLEAAAGNQTVAEWKRERDR
jgi:hypothetical protein